MPLLMGRELMRIMDHFSPFQGLNLKPEGERVTVLAANGNTPFELFARGFAMAAAQGEGSPVIVQLSYNAILLAGSESKALKPIKDVSRAGGDISPAVEGAIIAANLIETYADQYGADLMAISLDHFKVPKFDPTDTPEVTPNSLPAMVARARLIHAMEAMRPVFGAEVDLSAQDLTALVNYLCSPAYRSFKEDFLAVISAIAPAWGMIDTEKLPPLLDFMVTRDIIDSVRIDLGNRDVIIEAEFGATGQSGQPLDYERIRGPELENFARKVATFLDYTGAEGIAYPIGMEHAAKAGVTHEPDVERLEAVGRTVLEVTGRYVPFVQHGGTGAAQVARGLVGKNNINTKFLVTAANTMADHVQGNLDAIRGGEKDACGTKIYTKMITAIAEAAVEKLKESGSHGKGPEVRGLLGYGY